MGQILENALELYFSETYLKTLLMKDQSLKAVKQYAFLKTEYNTKTIITFSH